MRSFSDRNSQKNRKRLSGRRIIREYRIKPPGKAVFVNKYKEKGLLHNGPRKKTVSKTLRRGSLLTVFVVRCSC